jgi:hypothetical protein
VSGLGLEYGEIGRGDEDWSRLADLMRTTAGELEGAPVGGLAPSVQGAATAFLSAWAGYAAESAAIADGLADALRLLVGDVRATEEQRQEEFGRLDSRLGSAR